MWITEEIEKGWPKILGGFYEEILRKWFENEQKWELKAKAPRVYFTNQKSIDPQPHFQYINWVIKDFNKQCQNNSYFMTDGFYINSKNKNTVVEAKSWVPGHTWGGKLTDSYSSNRFFLADNLTFKDRMIQIDHYVLVYWSAEADGNGIGEFFHNQGKIIHQNILNEYREIWPERTFEVLYLIDIYSDLIRKQSRWYLDIIRKEEKKIKGLFDLLSGKN
ncbi:MAG: hypothetical protein ACTSP3_00075 [Candidatus Heimdallarchaeaceae archaeon]